MINHCSSSISKILEEQLAYLIKYSEQGTCLQGISKKMKFKWFSGLSEINPFD